METENARTQSYLTYEEIWNNEEENSVKEFEQAQHSTDILLQQYQEDIQEDIQEIDFGIEDTKKEIQMKNYVEVSEDGKRNTRNSIAKITRAVLKEEREKNDGYGYFKKKKKS